MFTPEDRAQGDAEREMTLARDTGRDENERWHARKDGSVFYGSGSVMPLRDKSGALRGFVKIMRDLTESKRTQEELRRQMDELTRFNTAAVGRETRMIELKDEINGLFAANRQTGRGRPRYGDGPRGQTAGAGRRPVRGRRFALSRFSVAGRLTAGPGSGLE